MNLAAMKFHWKAPPARTKKTIKMLGNILFVALMLVIAVALFFAMQGKLTGSTPRIAGYKLLTVLSGSMEPELHTGSLVFVKQVEPNTLAVNDIITFRSLNDKDMLITHRIVAVNSGADLSFTTKGDANDVSDPQVVPAANIVGKTNFSIPYIGYLLDFARSKPGILFLVILPSVALIIYELFKIYKLAIQHDREKQAKIKAESEKAKEEEGSDAPAENTQS